MSEESNPIDLQDVATTLNALLRGMPFTLLCVPNGQGQPGLGVTLSNCGKDSMIAMIRDAYQNSHTEFQTFTGRAGNG